MLFNLLFCLYSQLFEHILISMTLKVDKVETEDNTLFLKSSVSEAIEDAEKFQHPNVLPYS